MKNYVFFLSLILFSVKVNEVIAQSTIPSTLKEKFNINKTDEDAIGYCQAVKIENTLYVSGSVGWGPMQEALVLAYDEIKKTLDAYHANFYNIVKENLYTTCLDSVIMHKDIRRNYYGDDFPAATWVEVKRLYNPGLVVEIEVIAVLPEDK
jgi:2-iminobutanoate/2-iminopropanoate deaminase